MKTLLGCLAGLFLAGSAARADEMDREAKGKSSSPVAAVASVAAGTELDKESPDQSHGRYYRGGWGGYGYGGGYRGGWSVGYYGGGWGVGYSSGWGRPYYGGWGYSSYSRPYYGGWGYSSYSRPYYGDWGGYSVGYSRSYYGGQCGCW